MIIHETAMGTLETRSRRIRHLAGTWPYFQRVVDATIDDAYWRGLG